MNCPFCNNRMQVVHQDFVTDSAVISSAHTCGPCGANLFYSHEHDLITSYEFSRESFVCVFYPKAYRQTEIFYMFKDNEDEPIIKLDFLPNLNPKNFLKKLPTLLTFS